MRAIAILVAAALWVAARAAMAETSCEDPEWFKKGNWYATRLSKRGGVEIGIVGEGETFIPTDTISIHCGMLLEEYYHSVDRPEEFIFVTDGWKDKIPKTYWLLNARTGEVRRLLDVPAWRTLGGVVLGCEGTRLLISAGRSYDQDVPRTNPSVTYLIDVDSGSVVREWEGLFFESCYRQYPSTAHYDSTTEAFWIGSTGYGPGYWTAEDDPKQIVRIDCVTGDTTWVDEAKLFGVQLKRRVPYDVYRGHMLVATNDGFSDEERGQTSRMLLVDLVELRPVAEWRLSWEGKPDVRGFGITEDLQGIIYYRDDENGEVHRLYLPIGATEAVEVNLTGGRTPLR